VTHLIYAILALQIADVLSTLYAFRNGAYEANPVMRRFLLELGTVPGLLLPKLIYAVPVWIYRDQFQDWGVWVVIAGYAAVVVNNVRIATKK
jgi:hypothetical protein